VSGNAQRDGEPGELFFPSWFLFYSLVFSPISAAFLTRSTGTISHDWPLSKCPAYGPQSVIQPVCRPN
jgi:hypothetical protein